MHHQNEDVFEVLNLTHKVLFKPITDIREYTSQSILIDPLYILVLEKKVFLPSFSFFRVYENEVLFFSFYSSYLDYEHEMLYTS